MDRENFMATIGAYQSRQPWRPYTISLVSGREVEVDFPGALNARDGVAVLLAPGGVPTIFDHEGVERITGDLLEPEEAR